MEKYIITVFEKDGSNVLDETFEAKDDREAKEIGNNMLKEKGFSDHTARVVSSAGKLIIFQR
ncbi:YhzD family protein [Pseudalkalibacillus caeni]|uniref:YhzD-like protein n=1 Tax=Exobacillus caeni TaxID=2574798 RepID=A0A5R9F6T5_9BACL|nr:YhzD family protein [Pseudalkalibacillus caeni]TLS38040.1 hypothetical protein FCL54_05705 [Pseudalkalibacillus caeni]